VIADFAPGSTVLVDSSALVYLVEGEPSSPRRRAVEAFMAESEKKGWRLVASALAWQELLEKPLRSGDEGLASRYRGLLADSRRIEILVVDVAAAEGAAALAASLAPARRRWISSADLVHVATAIAAGAKAIFGNDESWRELPSCPPLILVDELAAELELL
jgi:predicted nucleic acid-binding protein